MSLLHQRHRRFQAQQQQQQQQQQQPRQRKHLLLVHQAVQMSPPLWSLSSCVWSCFWSFWLCWHIVRISAAINHQERSDKYILKIPFTKATLTPNPSKCTRTQKPPICMDLHHMLIRTCLQPQASNHLPISSHQPPMQEPCMTSQILSKTLLLPTTIRRPEQRLDTRFPKMEHQVTFTKCPKSQGSKAMLPTVRLRRIQHTIQAWLLSAVPSLTQCILPATVLTP